jgi:DNA-binding transcriptional ArsR family regulator
MAKSRDSKQAEALGGLSELLQNRTRLGACVLLAGSDMLSFSRLKELLGESDGNLGAHLRKLEEAGLIDSRKEFVDRKPVTWYLLSQPGREVLKEHLAAIDLLVRSLNGKAR